MIISKTFHGLLIASLLFPLGICGASAAPSVVAERSGVVDIYEYVPDSVYQVRTGLGITTQIELDPGEKVLDYSTGFSSGWELTRRDNVFYLKPKNVDVDTNMVVRTETNSYIFELKVVATDWRALEQARREGVQYKIRFTYPQDARFTATDVKTVSEPDHVPVQDGMSTRVDKNRRYHYGYEYATRSRKAWLVPTAVYDDGRFTYIKLNDGISFPTGNFPAVYAREKSHSEEFVVNTTVEGNTIVLHGTYPFLIIRHGDNVVGLRRNLNK